MRIEDTKKEPEIAEMIEGSEGDRRRLSELLDGIRVGPGVDAMADEMREVVWADVRLGASAAEDSGCGLHAMLRLRPSWWA